MNKYVTDQLLWILPKNREIPIQKWKLIILMKTKIKIYIRMKIYVRYGLVFPPLDNVVGDKFYNLYIIYLLNNYSVF